MSVDINIKYPTHPRFKSGIFEVSDELEQILQHIEMTLYTDRGTVLGEEDFGAGLDSFLYKLNVQPKVIERLVYTNLLEEIPELHRYGLNVKVRIENLPSDSIGIVEIELTEQEQEQDPIQIQAIFR
jgi:hypothetical protein